MEVTQFGSAPILGVKGLKGSVCDLLLGQARQTSLGQGTVIFAPDMSSDSLLFCG